MSSFSSEAGVMVGSVTSVVLDVDDVFSSLSWARCVVSELVVVVVVVVE